METPKSKIPSGFQESGFADRKFVLACIALVLVAASFTLLDFLPRAAAEYGSFLSAIGSILTIYFTSNVAALHVATKNAGRVADDAGEDGDRRSAEGRQEPLLGPIVIPERREPGDQAPGF